MSPVKLAVIFDQEINAGGGYQQAINAALSTKKIPPDIATVYYYTNSRNNIQLLKSFGIESHYFSLNLFQRFERKIRLNISNDLLLKIWKYFKKKSTFETVLNNNNIDLVYFLSPTNFSNDLENINYICTIWDLCHRDFPEFPEIRSNKIFEKREKMYTDLLLRATSVIADSELGKKNIIRRYLIDEARVFIMSFEPSINIFNIDNKSLQNDFNVNERHNLKYPYIYYPAQFWAHKNHIYILEGLKILEFKYNRKIGAIFSGSDKGNLNYIKKKINEYKLNDRVIHVGFVENKLIPQYYKQSIGLVMPSYFGPTNLPPMEAFTLGVPVLYSNLNGLRDQVGDAALLLNLSDPDDLAQKIINLLDNKLLVKEITNKGLAIANNRNNNHQILKLILNDFQRKRACWGN
jgi:glycosyltransferase involved in cell wall biosynthesis